MAHGARERRFERRPSGGGFQAGGDAGLGVVSQALAQVGNLAAQIAGGQIDKHVRAEKAQITADLTTNLERISIENRDDPTAFLEIANGFSAGALDSAHPRHAVELQAFSDQLVGRYHNNLTELANLRQDDENRAKHNAGLNALKREVMWAARNLDPNDEASIEALAVAKARVVDSLVDATEGDGDQRAYKTDVEATNELLELDADTNEEVVWGGYTRAVENRSAAAFAADVADNKKAEAMGLTLDQQLSLQNRIRADMKARHAEANRADALMKKEAEAERERTVFDFERRIAEHSMGVEGVELPTLGELTELVNDGVLDGDASVTLGLLQKLTTAPVEIDDIETLDRLDRLYASGELTVDIVNEARDARMLTNATAAKYRELALSGTTSPIPARRRELAGVFTFTGRLGRTIPGLAEQRGAALEEYDGRVVGNGEDPGAVKDDIISRFNKGAFGQMLSSMSATSSLLLPRFAVMDPATGSLSIAETAAAVSLRFDAGEIELDEYERIGRNLSEWNDLTAEMARIRERFEK